MVYGMILQPTTDKRSSHDVDANRLTDRLSAERPHLVALCRNLTGDTAVAEDLAQETLLTAWRLREHLTAPDGLSAWLAAIARNHCRRWARAQAQHHARFRPLADDVDATLIEQMALEGDDPVEIVEREEMASLARQALAVMPPASRDLLVAAYLNDHALHEATAAPGASQGAYRARLTRARRAARAALSADSDLRGQLETFGLLLPGDVHWIESRIWCPFCGIGYLRYRIDREQGDFSIRCASGCEGLSVAGYGRDPELTQAVSSIKSLITRHCLKLERDYRLALQRGWQACQCGERISYRAVAPDNAPLGWPAPFGLNGTCARCGLVDDSTAWHLALDTQEAQRFWKRYPRMRALPMRGVEHDGRSAVVTGFEAVGETARLELVSDARDYTILHAALTYVG
jgi:RNA polymerase sigma-70 factor (ECF subfamily)